MAYAYTKAARTRTLQENLKHGVNFVNHALETNYVNCRALEEIRDLWISQITDVNKQENQRTYNQQNIVRSTNQTYQNPTQKTSSLKKQASYQQPVSQPPTPLEPLTAPPVPSSSSKPKPPPKTQKRTAAPTFSNDDSSSESRLPTAGSSYEILQPLQVAPARSNAPKPPPRNRNSTANVGSAIEATLQTGPKKPPAGAFNYMMAGQLPSKPTPPPRDGQAKETHF